MRRSDVMTMWLWLVVADGCDVRQLEVNRFIVNGIAHIVASDAAERVAS